MKKSIIAAVIAAAMVPTAQAGDVVIKLGGGLKAADKAKEIKFQTGGRLMWDYNNTTFDDGSDEVTKDSNLEVRRARLFVKTQIQDWALKSQFNIDQDGTDAGTPEDLYIQYKGFGKAAKITLGRQQAEFGLEQLTSSKDITFLERSAATEAYALGRQEGIQLQGDIDNLHYAVGVFEDGDDKKEAGKLFMAARAAYAIKSEDTLVHLGLAYNDQGTDTTTLGLELAAVSGPLHAQAEFMQKDEDGADADAFYLQVGYVLTGESRPYKGGKFKRVKPAQDSGAYEIVARYTDGTAKYKDIELDTVEGSEFGIGFNYYANNNVRLGLTYSMGEEDESGNEGTELRARAQLVF